MQPSSRRKVLWVCAVLAFFASCLIFLHLVSLAGGLVFWLASTAGLVAVASTPSTGSAAAKAPTASAEYHDLIAAVGRNSARISESSNNLASTAGEVSRMASEVSSTIQQVAKGTEEQSLRTHELKDIIAQVGQAADGVQKRAKETAEASEGASQTARTIHDLAQQATDMMTALSQSIENAATLVFSLGDKSQQIGQVADIIRSIADQTNLLALNAAIEAARAGENGRGFAVVADEVRKLAEGSAEASNQIGALIQEIQNETSRAVAAMQEGSKGVRKNSQVITDVGAGLGGIMQAVTRTHRLAEEISQSTQEQVAKTTSGAKRIEDISAIAEETAASTEQVAASTQQATASMEELTATSSQLADMGRELKELVAKIKISGF